MLLSVDQRFAQLFPDVCESFVHSCESVTFIWLKALLAVGPLCV